MNIIIKNGILVTGTDTFKADIAINNGKITTISDELTEKADKIIDATGKFVFPGFIDAHTHLELPVREFFSVDDFYTGTLAAAAGGTTCIVDYIVPFRGQTLKDAFKLWVNKANNKSVIDYGFHMTISDPEESIFEEIKDLPDMGVTSIKCFTAYKGNYMLTDDQIYRVFELSKASDILVSMHCENGYLLDYFVKKFLKEGKKHPVYHSQTRPPFVESDSIQHAIDIADFANIPIFIAHLSTAEGLKTIQKARFKNKKVFVETCPQYLLLDDSLYDQDAYEAAKYICSPPLRPAKGLKHLWNALLNGEIDVFATDHCPFNAGIERKNNLDDFSRIPNGLPGIEDRVNLLFSEGVKKRKLSLNRFVNLVSSTPAKIFGLYPQKGSLNTGSDADIVVYDPDCKWVISANNHHQNVDYNAYEGIEVTGKPYVVTSRGEIIVENGQITASKGRGKYIYRQKSTVYN